MEPPFDTVAVPVASEEDASVTCRAIRPYPSKRTEVIVGSVVEKAGGGIDSTSVEQQKRRADPFFDRCSRELSDRAGTVETTIDSHTDVAEGILEATGESDADVIALTPRRRNRSLESVSGDTAFEAGHGADRPVVVVPSSDDSALGRE